MKTLTEFFGMNLKQAAQTRKELMDSGKTPEELTPALGEALKLEGERLNHLIQALEAVGTRLQDLKRVVVYALNEGEKAPQKAVQKGDHYYLVEYYPSLEKPKSQASSGRFDKDDKKGRRNKKRGRRNDRQDQRKPHLSSSGTDQPSGSTEGAEGAEPRRRRPRRFPKRAPRPQGPAQPTTGRIIPLAEKLAQEAAVAAAATATAHHTLNTQSNPTESPPSSEQGQS